ncbi:hypothetical protein FRB95_005289, partial [Tulasnella sp. JGI-2019a]
MRRLNSRAPIHRLPNELLVEILALTISTSVERERHNLRMRFARISRDWSRFVFETPSLWTEISSIYAEGENRAVVLRSKEYPLVVEYNQSHCWCTEELMNLAIQVAYRWKSADFRLLCSNTLDLLRSFVPLSVPQLENLTVYCSDIGGKFAVEDSIDMFSEGADRLRHIDLFNVPIPWSSRLLSGLETIRIIGLNFGPSPTSSEITDVLRCCPELRSFELVYD